MELKVFDRELTPLGVIDEVDSLIWGASYWQQGNYGDCKLLAPATDTNNELLVKGNILVLHDIQPDYVDESGGVWRRGIEITYRHITKDENDAEQVEIQGSLLKKWLAKRIIEKQIILSATNQQIINKIISLNMGSTAAQRRQFEQFTVLQQQDLGGEAVEYSNEEYVSCAEEIYNRALLGKLGYEILVNEREKTYGFYLWKGKDLTATNTQGNTPCIFSRSFDNINELEYTESIENIKNAIYVQGAADENDKRYTVEVAADDSGLDRDEVYLEASDISWTAQDENGQEITIDLATYLKLLAQRGNAELDTYGETINFEAAINTASNLDYKTDYDVGDVITCIEQQWGIKIDARITQITKTYQDGKTTIEATFGDSLPTLIQKIKKAR